MEMAIPFGYNYQNEAMEMGWFNKSFGEPNLTYF
jgi:hypothetical protein